MQRGARLLPGEDPEISAAVTDGFNADGIDLLVDTECVAVRGRAGHVQVDCADGSTLTGSHLLIAAGRVPNSDRLGVEHLGLDLDLDGFIPVDDGLHTTADDVWVIGDLRGGPMFTHTARDDADIVYRSVFKGEDRSTTGRVIPHAVFVDPEVASVGLTEPQARAQGFEVLIGRQAFSGVPRALAIGSSRGLVKFVADAATDRILGCHIAGPDAGNLIHEALIAMVADATYSDIARAIHVHPTIAEGVNTAAGGIHREIGL